MRGVIGARAEPHVERAGGIGLPRVLQHLDGLVGQVLGEVIAILRQGMAARSMWLSDISDG